MFDWRKNSSEAKKKDFEDWVSKIANPLSRPLYIAQLAGFRSDSSHELLWAIIGIMMINTPLSEKPGFLVMSIFGLLLTFVNYVGIISDRTKVYKIEHALWESYYRIQRAEMESRYHSQIEEIKNSAQIRNDVPPN